MAKLEHIEFIPQSVEIMSGEVNLTPRTMHEDGVSVPMQISSMPVLLWASGEPWVEANLFLSHRAELVFSRELNISTVHTDALTLYAYANFLELKAMTWYTFGGEKRSRPTNAFRGHLISQREKGKIAATTASARMSGVIRFYKWIRSQKLLTSEYPAFEDRIRKVTYRDKIGFEQSLTIYSTNLNIPHGKGRGGSSLEGGLRPVSIELRDRIMLAAAKYCSIEFQLMLGLGFATGMRLQSILDLKIDTLQNAQAGETEGSCYLSIGPKARPSVATKFGVNGRVFIPLRLLRALRKYVTSVRRQGRAAKAITEDRDTVFLNRFGRRYARCGSDKSPTVNHDMTRLRRMAACMGLDLRGFYFHCTRATFATIVASTGMQVEGLKPAAVIRRVKDLLLHRNEATSQKYLDYVDDVKVQAAYEQQYTTWFFGGTLDV